MRRRGGQPVYVRDVARARLGTKKPDGIVRRFGANNIAIRVTREAGANVLEVMRRLRAVGGTIDASLAPKGLSLSLIYEASGGRLHYFALPFLLGWIPVRKPSLPENDTLSYHQLRTLTERGWRKKSKPFAR